MLRSGGWAECSATATCLNCFWKKHKNLKKHSKTDIISLGLEDVFSAGRSGFKLMTFCSLDRQQFQPSYKILGLRVSNATEFKAGPQWISETTKITEQLIKSTSLIFLNTYVKTKSTSKLQERLVSALETLFLFHYFLYLIFVLAAVSK